MFVIALVPLLVIDTLPWAAWRAEKPKRFVQQITMRLGLWQGEWSLFAPNPSVNNYWLTADAKNSRGEEFQWMTPYWPTVGAVEKFRQFRYLNYYNRLNLLQNRIANQDLAEYLSHTLGDAPTTGEQLSVQLYLNGVNLVPPPPGEMPAPEELAWVTFSEAVAEVTPSNSEATSHD